MEKLNNSKRTLVVLEKLRLYSNEKHLLTAADINSMLAEEGFTKVNRKTIYEDIYSIEDSGYNLIRNKSGAYLDGNPFTYYEVKLLTDVINSLPFLNKKDKQDLNEKLYLSIDKERGDYLRSNEVYGISNKGSRPYYYLENIYNAIFNSETIVLTNKKGSDEVIPYTCVMNGGFYYLVYQYPGNKKLYTRRFDRIKKIEKGRSCDEEGNEKLFNDKELKKYLKQNVGSYHGSVTYRIEVEVTDSTIFDRAYEVLSTDFKEVVVSADNHFHFDVIDAPTTYANLLKLGSGVRIIPTDDSKLIIDNYIKVLKETLNLY